jgi:hypothetical protein
MGEQGLKASRRERQATVETRSVFGVVAFLAFALLCAACVWLIRSYGAFELASLSTLDFLVLGFACLRLIHLISYDKILDPLRERLEGRRGIRGLLADFVACLWCTGVWSAMIVATVYFLGPWGRFAIWVLAIAGLGSLLQVVSRAVSK